MDYTISYFSEAVQEDIFALPDTLAARYVVLSRRMVAYLFCTPVGKRIVMLHSFVKKSDRTPLREREIAQTRMKEFKHANT